jgi:hypothetical protein
MPRKDPEAKKEYNRQWRKANPNALKQYYKTNKERFKAHNKKNRDKASAYIQEAKKGKSCSICGWDKHHCALDFHHTDPSTKSKEVAAMAQTGSIKKIQEEMDKCILVCANCHRILHHERRQRLDTPTSFMVE